MRSSGCDDYDFLVYSGHTEALDYPISRSVDIEGGRVSTNFPRTEKQKALKRLLRPTVKEVTNRTSAERTLGTDISDCVSAYATGTYNSW